jgi:small subunit ribosomal protein S1
MAPDDTDDFAKMFAESEGDQKNKKKRREAQPGDQVKGRIISISGDAAFLDLGGKSDGMIDLAELRDRDGKVTVKVGDELQAHVVENNPAAGVIMLRRVLGRGAEGKAELEQAFAAQIPVEGHVTGVNKGGVEVQVAGVRAFCPISQLDLRHTEDAAQYVGQRLQFVITRYEAGGRQLNIVLSRRPILEAAQQEQAAHIRGKLEVGAVMRGKVTALKDYGAFVDLGGIEGMLHVSELGFQRVSHPRDMLAVGQEIEVQILKLEKSADPKRSEKISLSLKSLAQDPWREAVERFKTGVHLDGKVVRVESFGAFIEVAPGVEGLVHISELGQGKHVRHAKDVLQVGQALRVVVLGVDLDKRRLSLRLEREDDDTEGDVAAHAANAAGGFATFGDLLSKAKKG